MRRTKEQINIKQLSGNSKETCKELKHSDVGKSWSQSLRQTTQEQNTLRWGSQLPLWVETWTTFQEGRDNS